MFDRDGNLWIATYYDGLQRVARPDPRGAASPAEAAASVERFTVRDGLSSNATTQLFQDVEGNVWLGTENGLDRFWPATVRFEPELADPAAFGDLLLQATDGSIYIGEASTVYRVRPGGRPEPILKTRVEPRTLCEAPDGAIWIGTNDKEVVIWQEGRVRRLGQRAPLSFTIYDCAFDARGDYWITASLGGMARFRDGRWERMFGPGGGAFLPKSMLADARGRLFVHWNDRTLSVLDGSAHNAFPIPFGGYLPYDVVLHSVAPDTVYVAGRFGLARLQHGRFQTLYARQAPLFSDVKGMVRTPAGDMWLAGPGGIMRMTAAQLERAFAKPSQPLSMELFGAGDGLRSRPHSHSRNAIVQGGDGRLWIATQTGTVWLDPANISLTRTPPRVAVSALSADRVYRDPSTITLPAGTSNIQIDFAMLAFSNPRSAHVRYRIEGQDPDWIEAGARRQAFYTNLRPGKYAFRLMASNDDGVSSASTASVGFELLPAFHQTRWFFALCVVAAAVMLWIAYLLRVRQLSTRMQQLHEERMDERMSIAHELHDTLLQGVLSTSMQLQVLAMQIQPESKPLLDHILNRMAGVIEEGRQALRGLRASDGHQSLEQVFSEMKKELAGDDVGSGRGFSGGFRVIVAGDRRPLPPALRDEIYRIGREALVNAFRHAQANNVEVEVEFFEKRLVLRVRDDGRGIDPAVLQSGLDNHFGLPGMRERADTIGGQLRVISRPGAGTEIELSVPLAEAPHFWRAITISRRPNRRASTE
jgi:signal transduction histidine kinase